MKRVLALLAVLALSGCAGHFVSGSGGSGQSGTGDKLNADTVKAVAAGASGGTTKVRVLSQLDHVDKNAIKAFAATRQPAITPEANATIDGAMQVAVDFRSWMAADPAKLRSKLSSAEASVLDGLVDPGNPAAPTLWREFFRGSVMMVGYGFSGHPRVGFYNPLVDGWVIADFDPSAKGGMTLARLVVMRGDRLAKTRGAGDTVPPWTKNNKMPIPSALALAQAANMAAFERAYPPLGKTAPKPISTSNGDEALIANRMAHLGASIAGFHANKSYQALADKLLKAIRDGDMAKLGTLVGNGAETVAPLQRLAGFSANARKSLELRGAFGRRDGNLTLAFGSPFSGRWMIFVDMNVAGGTPRLTNALAVDLGQLS